MTQPGGRAAAALEDVAVACKKSTTARLGHAVPPSSRICAQRGTPVGSGWTAAWGGRDPIRRITMMWGATAEEVQMTRRERRRFTDEYKAEVVALVR